MKALDQDEILGVIFFVLYILFTITALYFMLFYEY